MLQQLSVDSLLGYINKANGTTYVAADVVISKPQVVTGGSWHSQVTAKNTVARVSAAQGSNYRGSKQVVYDRLSLNNLAGMKGFGVYAHGVTSNWGLIPALKNYTGLHFTTQDLVDTPLTDNGDGTFTAVLSASPDSLGWVGSVSLLVKDGGVPLDQAITVTNLLGLNYPTANEADTFGPIYLYGYDFTTYFADMSTMAPGVVSSTNADKLVVMLKALDISPNASAWTNTPGATAWNLSGATVVSNGINSSSLPTNQSYKYVMVLQLAAGVTTPAGVLYLHYNDPFDPSTLA